MISEREKNIGDLWKALLQGPYRVLLLLFFSLACQLTHVLLNPFPKRDALTYLHILHEWNVSGSFSAVLEKFPKFALLLFSFLPLKWADQAGIPLYPASIVWMIFFSLVSVYAFYKIVLLLSGSVTRAMWCGAFFAIHPMIMLYAGNLLRDTPYLTFCLLHVLFFIESVKKREWYFFLLTGAALAMCLLCRFEAWELLVISPVFSIFYMIRSDFSKREVFLYVFLAAAGFCGTAVCMLAAIDNPGFLFAEGKQMVLSFFPDWMGVK